MMRAKILHLIGDLGVGGAQAMLFKLLARTDREQFDPVVIELSERGDGFRSRIRELGIGVTTVGMSSLPRPGELLKLARAVRNCAPDLINAWMYHSNLFAALICSLLERKVPLVYGIRQSLYDLRLEKRTTQWVIRAGGRLSDRAAKIVYNAQISSEQHEALGYERSRRLVIPNGFDCAMFQPSAQARVDVRRALKLEHEAGLIGMLARVHPIKDHPTFLKAAALMRQSHPKLHFLLAGEGTDAAGGTLDALIGSLGLASCVHRLGVRSDIPSINAALDIAALTSRFEAFPNVIGEAMACGVPCVASDAGETRYVIGETGRVVPPRDPEAFAAAWRELWNLGPGGRAALGERARQRIQEHYELGVVARRFESLYRELLAQ